MNHINLLLLYYYRAKNYRLTHNGQDKPEDEVSPDEAAGTQFL